MSRTSRSLKLAALAFAACGLSAWATRPRAPHHRSDEGVIWPWLLGPFVRAYLAVHGRAPERLAYCRALSRGLELHLAGEACVGTVSEIFEAEAPFRADGAPAQAWSVAELLSVLTKELAAPVRERFNPRETLRCAV